MLLDKITEDQIELLQETFTRNVTRPAGLTRDDRVAVAQGVLLNISNLADLVNKTDQDDKSQILLIVTNVLNYCARIVENSDSSALKALAPEIREQAAVFQPEMA